MRRASRRLILGMALAGLVLGLIAFLCRAQDAEFYSAAHRRLLAAAGPLRPVEARLSGLQVCRPYQRAVVTPTSGRPPVTRRGGSADALRKAVSPGILFAIQSDVEREPTAENIAAAAILSLAEGDPEKAIRALRKALAERPSDPRLLNDLGAALLAHAEATGELSPALEALEALQHSAEVSPSPAALFNLSLALERLGLRERAMAAWSRYLAADGRSEWASESRERLARLESEVPEGRAVAALLVMPDEAATLGRNPWAERQLGERTLLGRWAERSAAGDTAGAAAALAGVERLAASLTAGGRLLAASAAAIREAERAGDRVRLGRLQRGHAELDRAFQLHRKELSMEDRRRLDQSLDGAVADLQAAGSPFALRARFLRARAAREPDWAELRRIEQAALAAEFLCLVADARRLAAFWMTLEGRFDDSLAAYEEAGRRFAALGEHEVVPVVAAMRADLFENIGNRPLEIAELTQALAGAPAVSDPWHRYSLYVVAATAVRRELPRAAVELRREAAAACRDLLERPLCDIDSMLAVARLTPDAATAGEVLEHAERLLDLVPDGDDKLRTALDLASARAAWLVAVADLDAAAELYADVAARYEAMGHAPNAARTRARLARTLERLGRVEESAAAYRDALRRFRAWDRAERFRPENAEKSPPGEMREVYESLLLLELAASGGEPSRTAFLLSEEMRGRLAPRRTPALPLPEDADLDRWLAAVPAGTAVVEYALVGDRGVAWILAGGRLDQVALTPRPRLAERIQALGDVQDPRAWRRRTGSLFGEVLAPVLARLPQGTARLVVVPDSELYGLPFRALWNPAARRYVDEDLVLTLAPGVGHTLGRPGERRPDPSAAPLPALSVGFPEFARELRMDRLPAAGEEAAAVRSVYGARAEDCPVGDWESLRRCAPLAPVIHLATHTAADPRGSWIALPGETVSLDRLWRELPELPGGPLVVLSSCESVATAEGGEGLGGLARPFLASGARAVVGTLWPIDDPDAVAYFPAFHRAYRQTGDPAEALRRARDGLDRWRERPWVWGGVEVVE